MDEALRVENGLLVSIAYVLRVDGEVIDSSTEDKPLSFVQGSGQIIRGLDRELLGMSVGDTKIVEVAPADGYGLREANRVERVPRLLFPKEVPAKVGTRVQVRNPQGVPQMGRISAVTDELIELDFNHELAGKTLVFEVKIVRVEKK